MLTDSTNKISNVIKPEGTVEISENARVVLEKR